MYFIYLNRQRLYIRQNKNNDVTLYQWLNEGVGAENKGIRTVYIIPTAYGKLYKILNLLKRT